MKKFILSVATMFFLCASVVSIAAPLPPELCFSATGLNISINWTSIPDATGYRLYYAPYPYKGEDTIGSFDMGTVTSASYYLWNNANYYIAATSRDASGESPYSNIELFQLTSTTFSESLAPCQTATLVGTWGNGVTNMALMEDGSYFVDTDNDGVAEAWGNYDTTESQLELTDEGGTSACFDVAIQEFIVGSYSYTINQESMTLTLIDDDCTGRAASMTNQWNQDDSPSSSISNPSNGKTNSAHIDNDGDGYSENYGDCNDNNSIVGPSATEICGDGIDQNCDGQVDEGCSSVDRDNDGFTNPQDCNDYDSSMYPGAPEICGDGIDQDCDGEDNICPIDPLDVDNDGDGFSENQGDCKDNNQSISPSSTEICGDGIDQNCNGTVDEGCVDTSLDGTWYLNLQETNWGEWTSELPLYNGSYLEINGTSWHLRQYKNGSIEEDIYTTFTKSGNTVYVVGEGQTVQASILIEDNNTKLTVSWSDGDVEVWNR